MKSAPNLKKQPYDKMTEVIIFAGSDAWAHAKQWQEQDGRLAGDNVPPVVLADDQLDELAELRIIDEGRYCVRLYKAGHIRPSNINAIAHKLAAAGVTDANYYPEGCTAICGRTGANTWNGCAGKSRRKKKTTSEKPRYR